MMKFGSPDDRMVKLVALDHLFFSNGLIRLHCTLSNFNLFAPNFNWEILDVMQAENEYIGLNSQLFVPLIFQKLCDDYQC